jgi:hypothetical protein
MPAEPQWVPGNAGAMQGDLIWTGAAWTWKTGLRRDGYQWTGREWVEAKPQRWWSHTWVWLLIGGVAVAVTLLSSIVAAQLRDDTGERGGQDSVSELRRDAYTECKVAVLGYLKSPGSADFPWYDPSFVAGNGPFLVSAYVDAENSFGASIRTPWQCAVTRTGSSWRVTSVVLDE